MEGPVEHLSKRACPGRWGFTPLEEAKRFNKLKVADYLENQMAARTDNGTD